MEISLMFTYDLIQQLHLQGKKQLGYCATICAHLCFSLFGV